MRSSLRFKTYSGYIDASPWTMETVAPYLINGEIILDVSQMFSGEVVLFETEKFLISVEYVKMNWVCKPIYARRISYDFRTLGKALP
jgi:hypothetical protein